MARSRKYEVGVGCLLLAAVAVTAIMALQMGAIGWRSETVVWTSVEDATGLTNGASVALAGVDIGTVHGLEVQDGRARLTFGVDPAAGVKKDATVRVRARSVLGEKYLEVAPHLPEDPAVGLVEAGDELASPVRGQVGIDELVNAAGPLVEKLQPLVDNLDPEVLQATTLRLMDSLRADPERLARMIENLDTALANGAEASQELPDLVREGRSTLASARDSLRRLDRAVSRADALLARSDGLMNDLSEAAEPLPELVVEVRGAVDDARIALGDAREALEVLGDNKEAIAQILHNLSEIDKWELRRLLREEGIKVRLRTRQVDPSKDGADFDRHGKVKD